MNGGLVEPCKTAAMSVNVTFQLDMVDGNGEDVDLPTEEVDEPGPAEPITLKPHGTAFQGIKWRIRDKSLDTCEAGGQLRFNLGGSPGGPLARLISFPPPEKFNITMKSLSLGTLQPTREGVVAW